MAEDIVTAVQTGLDYTIYFGKPENDVRIGILERDVDGYFRLWIDKSREGNWSAYVLRAIADLMDKINKPWDDEFNKGLDEIQEKEAAGEVLVTEDSLPDFHEPTKSEWTKERHEIRQAGVCVVTNKSKLPSNNLKRGAGFNGKQIR